MKTFFDSDRIECIEVSLYKLVYSNLDWSDFANKTWEINNILVMAFADFLLMLELYNTGLKLNDINYSDVAHCSVCRKVILPDDEAYSDLKTEQSLCGAHSFFDESIDAYRKRIF